MAGPDDQAVVAGIGRAEELCVSPMVSLWQMNGWQLCRLCEAMREPVNYTV